MREKMSSVLIAEDDEYIGKLLGKMLIKEGYEVDIVESGSEAIKGVSTKPFDVLVLDIHIPGINGIDAIPLIKRINSNIPVIIITADHSPVTEQKARKQGIYYYLLKPFKFEELKKVIESALSRGK